ncbi:MAG: hypothetical protein LBM02_00750 [Lachnospiraceae bacterium]|jgi:type VII secretion effector (TIGR04197 family)|nr:hypothetical protein [Lachnospiraceae bacterium]
MGTIISNSNIAREAIAGVNGVTIANGTKVSFDKSNIDGMKKGQEANNQLMSDLKKLVTCVQKQANKFPKIADQIEQRDKVDRKAFGFD